MNLYLEKEEQKIILNYGYDKLFALFLLIGFFPIPFAIYTIKKKMYKEMVSTFVVLYIFTPIILMILSKFDGFIPLIIGLLILPVVLFYCFYIVPRYLVVWNVKKHISNGFVAGVENTQKEIEIIKDYVSNDTMVGTIYKY